MLRLRTFQISIPLKLATMAPVKGLDVLFDGLYHNVGNRNMMTIFIKCPVRTEVTLHLITLTVSNMPYVT